VKDGHLAAALKDGDPPDGEPPESATPAQAEPTLQAGAPPGGDPPDGGPPDGGPPRTASDRRAMLAELMKAHGEEVLGVCMRLVRTKPLAEDLRQQVFLEAYRDLDRFKGHSPPRAWLFGIANHRCLDAIKAMQRHLKLIDPSEEAVAGFQDPGPGPLEHVDRALLIAALEQCLNKLSPEVRATVLMRFQTGATYEEMAEPLAAAADTLQVRVARALRKLRRCLERKGWTGE